MGSKGPDVINVINVLHFLTASPWVKWVIHRELIQLPEDIRLAGKMPIFRIFGYMGKFSRVPECLVVYAYVRTHLRN